MSQDRVDGTARGETPARILDLSARGALMVLRASFEVGAIHDFAIDLEGETLWVQGEVRRCRPRGAGAGFEVGVEFIGIDPHDDARLRRYLSRP